MASQYKQKKAVLASTLEQSVLSQKPLLEQLYQRYCFAPFPKGVGFAPFWIEVWESLSSQGREKVVLLPDPCLNHLEKRDVKPERSQCLRPGLGRLILFDEALALDGLRLYPHETCRVAEAIGPLPCEVWKELGEELLAHRLWQVPPNLDETQLWKVAETFRPHRDLPQPILDYLDQDRPKEKAPWQDFEESFQRYVLRRKIEHTRSATYRTLREHDVESTIRAGQTS